MPDRVGKEIFPGPLTSNARRASLTESRHALLGRETLRRSPCQRLSPGSKNPWNRLHKPPPRASRRPLRVGVASVLDGVPTCASPIAPECFRRLMAGVREGCPEARRELFERFQPSLLAAVRGLLNRCPCLRQHLRRRGHRADGLGQVLRDGRPAGGVLRFGRTESVPCRDGYGPSAERAAKARHAKARRRRPHLVARRRFWPVRVPLRGPAAVAPGGGDLQEQLDRVLDARPAQQRRIFYLYLAGRPIGEIAARVGAERKPGLVLLADIRHDLPRLGRRKDLARFYLGGVRGRAVSTGTPETAC